MKLIKALASLRITVALLALSMFIVFAGTVAQIDHGIWQVISGYFRTLVAWIPLRIFFPRGLDFIPDISFPFPGGWLLGACLVVNLLCAMATRFRINARGRRAIIGSVLVAAGFAAVAVMVSKSSSIDSTSIEIAPYWRIALQLLYGTFAASVLLAGMAVLYRRQCGLVLLHSGVILLMLSELFTGLFAAEWRMAVREGETVDWVEDIRTSELAVVDTSQPDKDVVVVVPENILKSQGLVRLPVLPFDVVVKDYMPNSALFRNDSASGGEGVVARAVPVVSGVSAGDSVDMPSAYVEARRKNGGSMGTYLVSTHFDEAVRVSDGGRDYLLYLRFRRKYKPYSIHLIDFRFDRYPGTNVPRNYSSDVILTDYKKNITRHVRIWMNNPLRYGGDTLYQASFAPDEMGTVLQVVTNATWMLPYVSCMIVATGMLAQFGMGLGAFLSKRKS